MAYCPPQDRPVAFKRRTNGNIGTRVKFRALYTDGTRGIVPNMVTMDDPADIARVAKAIARQDNVQSVLPIRIPANR
jgi:hypothetical protein